MLTASALSAACGTCGKAFKYYLMTSGSGARWVQKICDCGGVYEIID